MSGTDIADEIAAALAEAGEAVGDGPLICTFKRPGAAAESPLAAETLGDDPASYFEVTVVQDNRRVRDSSGALTGQFSTILMVEATRLEPLKSDLVAVGVRLVDVDAQTNFNAISDVVTTAPGGVAVLYEVTLAG